MAPLVIGSTTCPFLVQKWNATLWLHILINMYTVDMSVWWEIALQNYLNVHNNGDVFDWPMLKDLNGIVCNLSVANNNDNDNQ